MDGHAEILFQCREGGFSDAHATAAACSDPNAVAWVEAYISDTTLN